MARRPVTTYSITDDLTGEEIPEDEATNITFSYGGNSYEIDLSNKNAKKLDDFLAPYIDAARKVRSGSTATRSKSPANRDLSGRDLNAVREWASKNGYAVAPRGRVAKNVLDAYDAAN